LATAHPRTSA